MNIYSDVQCLSLVVGQKLKKVLALSYCCEGDINSSSIQEVQLELEELNSVRVFCGVDGSSICWDQSDLQPLSMGEYGELKICNLSESDKLCKDLVDKKLEKVYLVTSEIENCIIALKFVFSDAFELVLLNIGDDLKLQKQLSHEILKEEKSQFLDIQQITH